MSERDSRVNLMRMNAICSCIHFTGEGVVGFLNNLLISNLEEFPSNNFHYSALCNPKGRIISSLWVNVVGSDEVFIICPANMLDFLLHFFMMRRFRMKLEIEQSDINFFYDTNSGKVCFSDKDGFKDSEIEEYYNFMFDLGLPWIDSDTMEKFIPQHLNLDSFPGVMSFEKGCYPGQEIIARIRYLGKVKKRMIMLSNDNADNLAHSILEKHQQSVSPVILDSNSEQYRVQIVDNMSQ